MIGIVSLGMRNDYRIDVDKVFTQHPYAREILDCLSRAGYEAVLIGGVVRDAVRSMLDQSTPFSPHEVDIATSALPQEVRRLFHDRPIVGVGEEFGVLVIAAPDSQQYEVATFRTEGEYDGSWPGKVELVRDLAGDVNRRDLTINGLAATRDGTVIDLVGGIEDLKEESEDQRDQGQNTTQNNTPERIRTSDLRIRSATL